MTDQKKISRREAIKLLGAAAGASVLANLPSKWSKPELTGGVLPAHAQVSNLGLAIIDCDFTLDINTGIWSSTPYIVSTVDPPLPLPFLVGAQYTFTFVNTHFTVPLTDPQSPNPFIGNWTIDSSTGTTVYVNSGNTLAAGGPMAPDAGQTSGSVTVRWDFLNPSTGTGFCEKTVDWNIIT